jgi:diguanylate cyclase (GGDEF)-like protein
MIAAMFMPAPTLRQILNWLTSDAMADLVVAGRHDAFLTRQRLLAIDVRVRLIAAAFGFFNLLWIALDAATLAAPMWQVLALCRVLSAVVFMGLALSPQRDPKRGVVLLRMGLTLLVPMATYGVALGQMSGHSLDGLAAVNATMYRTLPMLALAGLSVFPLVAIESGFVALVLGGSALVLQGLVGGFDGLALASSAFVMVLMAGVYSLAAVIQLHYMAVVLRQASHDPLTDALTRRSGTDVLEQYFRLASGRDAPLVVLFMDADNFKSVNDQFGHAAGDVVLKSMVTHLTASLRQGDFVMRWGGEEFVAILPNMPMDEVVIVLDRIMRDGVCPRPDGKRMTVSIGVAERKTDAALDWQRLIALADERMYAAKKAGKARCVNHQGVMALPD